MRLSENEQTRAIRRAQHDGYAPWTVRPALRGELDYSFWHSERDDWRGVCWGLVVLAGVVLVAALVRAL